MRRGVLLAVFCAACSSASPDASDAGGPAGPDSGSIDGDGGPTPEVDGGDASNPVTGDDRIAILSLNLHCLKTTGTAFTTNEARFEAIAKTVQDERVSVILAQEVCISKTENARAMLGAALDKATGTKWSSVAALAHDAWVGTPDEASEHVAIFSSRDLTLATENIHRAQSTLRRVTVGATIPSTTLDANGKSQPFRIYSVHLDHADAVVRSAQAREVASAATVDADEGKLLVHQVGPGSGVVVPVIVAGDFNAQSGTDPLKAMTDYGFVEQSGSATTTRIDHVFAHRGAPIEAIESKVLFTGNAAVSDHPAVLVRFKGKPQSGVNVTRIVASGTSASPLTVRGDRAPLSWERGWPAYPRAAGGHGIVTSEIAAGAFTYKFLQNDTVWASGPNVSGTGETDNASTPSF
jgi:endonuclease/exonuclease/phosphatase family metal-dependent hydrolase